MLAKYANGREADSGRELVQHVKNVRQARSIRPRNLAIGFAARSSQFKAYPQFIFWW